MTHIKYQHQFFIMAVFMDPVATMELFLLIGDEFAARKSIGVGKEFL